MPGKWLHSAFGRYGLATSLVLGAFLGTYLQRAIFATPTYFFFYAAVTVTTWFFGRGPGWYSIILCTLVVDFFFIPPLHTFVKSKEDIPFFLFFAASSLAATWFSSWRQAAEAVLQSNVEERTADLQREMAERRRAEEAYYTAQSELARVAQMSTMGALAASIAHEVNQPLAAIVTYADACNLWLSSDPANIEEARAVAERIAQEGTRASEVVSRIRAMFTKEAQERVRLDVNELIVEVCSFMQAEAFRNHVTVRTELAGDLPPAIGDRVQIQQVVVNLILNAIEAMNAVTTHPREVVIQSRQQSGDEVLVAVRDAGVGIEPQDTKRIFDPFFTTKPRGMGMGLSISYSVIESHGGSLWATNNRGPGTTLQFTLPTEAEVTRLQERERAGKASW